MMDFRHGDSWELIKKLLDNSIGLLFTSPPYNVGANYNEFDDKEPRDKFVERLVELFVMAEQKMAPGGHILINLANTGRQPYSPLSDFVSVGLVKALKNCDMKGEVIWNKENITAATAWGSWMSPNQPSLRDQHEYILVFRKQGEREGKSDITRDEFIDFTKSMWNVAPETRREWKVGRDVIKHPAPFPVELAYRAIKLYSFIGETVLDPFCGTGTTLVTAEALGRNSIGFDLDSAYAKIVRKRMMTWKDKIPDYKTRAIIKKMKVF